MDQVILDRLRAVFPEAAIAHIYASTEAGAAIVVRDGREGFPVDWLCDGEEETSSDNEAPRLQLRDGLNKYFREHTESARTGLVASSKRTGRILGLVAECLAPLISEKCSPNFATPPYQ